jgi:hypothetical protein
MDTTLALSEVFSWSIRTRLDPALAAYGFHRIGGPWQRTAYVNGSRYLVVEIQSEPLDRPRRVTVTIGEGLSSADSPATPGSLHRFPLRAPAEIPGLMDSVVRRLEEDAPQFLSGEGRWRRRPAPFDHALPIPA